MKTLLLAIATAFTFTAQAGVPGSPIFDGVPELPVDACLETVTELATLNTNGFVSMAVLASGAQVDMPANVLTYLVEVQPGSLNNDDLILRGRPTILPAGLPGDIIPAPEGEPSGLPGDIIPGPIPTQTFFYFMEFNSTPADCQYLGSVQTR